MDINSLIKHIETTKTKIYCHYCGSTSTHLTPFNNPELDEACIARASCDRCDQNFKVNLDKIITNYSTIDVNSVKRNFPSQ